MHKAWRASAAALAVFTTLPQSTLMLLVRAYRYFLSPCLGPVCRYQPSCSAYALQALKCHGAVRGSALTAWRILRCNPWCDGGHDPVPASPLSPWRPAQGLFTRLLSRADAASHESPPSVRKLP